MSCCRPVLSLEAHGQAWPLEVSWDATFLFPWCTAILAYANHYWAAAAFGMLSVREFKPILSVLYFSEVQWLEAW